MELKPKICISGLSAVGKTSVCQGILKSQKLRYISGSSLLLELADRLHPGISQTAATNSDFWLSTNSQILNKLRSAHPELDNETDRLLLKAALSNEALLIDSLSVPALLPVDLPCFKIFLTASRTIRAGRASLSCNSAIESSGLRQKLRRKDKATEQILLASSGFRLFSPEYINRFDLIVDNTSFDDAADISRLESESKAKTLKIILSAIDLYKTFTSAPGTVENKRALFNFNRLLELYPTAIIKYPAQFNISSKVSKSRNNATPDGAAFGW